MKLKITKSILITVAVFCLLLGVFSFFLEKPNGALADGGQVGNVANFFSPATAPEYFKTTNAKYVDETDDYIAFVACINGSSSDSIVVYSKKDNSYRIKSDFYTSSPGQIQFANIGDKDYLLYQADLLLHTLDLTTFETSIIYNIDNKTQPITSYNFRYNGTYLVVALNDSLASYAPVIDGGKVYLRNRFTYKNDTYPTASAFVTLNSDNVMYFAIGETIYYDDVKATVTNNKESINKFTYEHSISYLLADGDRLYFISDNDVGYFAINQNFTPNVTIEGNNSEVLGNISSPKSLTIYDDELLIVDNTKSTVQKFDDVSFAFTGYAIATTESAENRIDKKSKHISLYNGNLATLSDQELALIDVEKGEYIKAQITDFTPEMLALGKDSIAIASSSVIKIYVVEDFALTLKATINNQNLKSCDYSCGKYYFYTSESNGSVHVYSESAILDGSTEKTVFATGLERFLSGATYMDVDVDGNANIYSANNKSVVRIPSNGDLSAIQTVALFNPSLRLESDLDGKVYSLADGNKIEYIDFNAETPESKIINFSLHENLKKDYTGISNQNAISMALNFDSQEVYFILYEQSVILSCDTFNNRSITSIDGANSAKDAFSGTEGLKTVQKAKVTGKNLYEVTTDDTDVFTYVKKFVAGDSEYLIIGEFANGYTLLLDEEKLVLIKTKDLPSQTTDGVTSSAKTTLYVSSSVNLYYYPVLSIDNTYCVYKANETSPVRFNVGQALTVEGEINLNDKVFYYITTTVNGEEFKGYVPSKFVKERLDTIDTLSKMTYATISAETEVLAEDRGSVIYTFTKDTKVRILGSTSQYTLIEFTVDGTLYRGYVNSASIITTPNNAVRNAVIIILISLAILATSIYVINKKKTYVDTNKTEY